jgi:prepilin-type N-terminal cleavage/methylation domain-containing protein
MKGFTLLEMMIVAAILAILAAIVFGTANGSHPREHSLVGAEWRDGDALYRRTQVRDRRRRSSATVYDQFGKGVPCNQVER